MRSTSRRNSSGRSDGTTTWSTTYWSPRSRRAWGRDAPSLESQFPAAGGAGGHRHGDRTVDGRYLDLRSLYRFREEDRGLQKDVVPLPAEVRMRQHAQFNLEIAAFPRSRPFLSLRRDADRGAVPRSRGNPDLDALLGFGHPSSVACRASAATGAAGPSALTAHAGSRIPDLADRPPDHVEKVDGQLDPDVASPAGMGKPRSTSAKHVAEKIPEVERLRTAPPGRAPRRRRTVRRPENRPRTLPAGSRRTLPASSGRSGPRGPRWPP